jgi:hypothetical protein
MDQIGCWKQFIDDEIGKYPRSCPHVYAFMQTKHATNYPAPFTYTGACHQFGTVIYGVFDKPL